MKWAITSITCGVLGLAFFWNITGGFIFGTCAINFYIFQRIRAPHRLAAFGLIIGVLAIGFSVFRLSTIKGETKEFWDISTDRIRMIREEGKILGRWEGSESKRTEVFSVPKKWAIFWQANRVDGKKGNLQVSVYPAETPQGDSERLEGVTPEKIAVGNRIPFHMLVSTATPESGWGTRSGYASIFPHSERAKDYMDGEVNLVIKAKDCDWIVKVHGITDK